MLTSDEALAESTKFLCWQMLSRLEQLSESVPPFSEINERLRKHKEEVRGIQKTLTEITTP